VSVTEGGVILAISGAGLALILGAVYRYYTRRRR